MTLPYSIRFNCASDLLQLEKRIRELLNCQTSTCSFLQSAEYMELKFAITRSFQKQALQEDGDEGQREPAIIRIPNSALFLCVSHDFTTVILDSKNTVYIEKRKQTAANQREDEDEKREEEEEDGSCSQTCKTKRRKGSHF